MDGDLSVSKLLFLHTRAYKKDAASLIASGPRGHIHFWNVFQGGKLMSQFLVVSLPIVLYSSGPDYINLFNAPLNCG